MTDVAPRAVVKSSVAYTVSTFASVVADLIAVGELQ